MNPAIENPNGQVVAVIVDGQPIAIPPTPRADLETGALVLTVDAGRATVAPPPAPDPAPEA